MANNAWYVLPDSSDRLLLQAIDKLCPGVWLTDQIMAVMVVKPLIQKDMALHGETQLGGSLRGKHKAAQLRTDGNHLLLGRSLT